MSINHRKYPKVWWSHNRRWIYSESILKIKCILGFWKHIQLQKRQHINSRSTQVLSFTEITSEEFLFYDSFQNAVFQITSKFYCLKRIRIIWCIVIKKSTGILPLLNIILFTLKKKRRTGKVLYHLNFMVT